MFDTRHLEAAELANVTLQELCAWVEAKWGPQERKLVVQVWGSSQWEAHRDLLETRTGRGQPPPASTDVAADVTADISTGGLTEAGRGEAGGEGESEGGEEGGGRKGGEGGTVQRGRKGGKGRKGGGKGEAKRKEERVGEEVVDVEKLAEFKRGLEEYPTLALPVPST